MVWFNSADAVPFDAFSLKGGADAGPDLVQVILRIERRGSLKLSIGVAVLMGRVVLGRAGDGVKTPT